MITQSKHVINMGILDDKETPHSEAIRRQRVLRANLRVMAEKNGIEYQDAIEQFAKQIGRSPNTIFMWMTSGFEGKGGARPIPGRHFDKLVEAGILDPTLTHWQGSPADAKRR